MFNVRREAWDVYGRFGDVAVLYWDDELYLRGDVELNFAFIWDEKIEIRITISQISQQF